MGVGNTAIVDRTVVGLAAGVFAHRVVRVALLFVQHMVVVVHFVDFEILFPHLG